MNSNVGQIRRRTRIALPADDMYLFRLGVALYGFAHINSFVCEVITYLDPKANRIELQGLTSGAVLGRFRSAIKQWSATDKVKMVGAKVATDFERLNTERSDFVHAYPITSPSGEQILHRRVDEKNKYFEVTTSFLDDFISRLENVSDGLYAIRSTVRPNI
ncbi:hypothetical protein [Bifidobacterium aquikefiri]|uniref:hypothetical protein n=1 Tax=Bifidobacterium aquikefiri TaxID=1653207 RepID=UPI0039ECE512